MAIVNLRSVPEELHMKMKMLQLLKEKGGKKIKLEELYIEVLENGIETYKEEFKDGLKL